MFLNAWSLSLVLCSAIVLFLGLNAARTGVRVLRFWDPASDSNLQISLENETWLASTLIEYAMVVQGLSLLIFLLAADNFSQVIAGAMCATGSLTANIYGMPALYVKVFGVFLYGFWILLHQLDIRSEEYPLVRIKYIYLLLLIPLIIVDIALQTLYIADLDPDIITSCCAVVFSDASGEGSNLASSLPQSIMLPLYYGSMICLAVLSLWMTGRLPSGRFSASGAKSWLSYCFAAGWLWFLLLSLLVITSVISSYIYAMPFHRCPFCIIKPEYHYIGLFIYLALIGGAFFGISVALAEVLGRRPGLQAIAKDYRRLAVNVSLVMLLILAVLSSYHYLIYMIFGGET
jgi:hypothetical protein